MYVQEQQEAEASLAAGPSGVALEGVGRRDSAREMSDESSESVRPMFRMHRAGKPPYCVKVPVPDE